MPREAPKKPDKLPEVDPYKPLARAKRRFDEYVRASDAVELLDPEGALETISNKELYPNGRLGGPNGTPTIKITPYGCQIIEFYAANALPHELIAKRLGISKPALMRRAMEQPEVAEALAVGHAENAFELMECLMGMARRGNVIAAIYLTKVLHKWRDNDPIQQTTQNNVVIQLPGSMTLEELKQLAASGVSPMQLPQTIQAPVDRPVIDVEHE